MVLMLVLVVLLALRDARAMTAKMNGDLVRAKLHDLRSACQFRDAVSYYQQTHQLNENALFQPSNREDVHDPLLQRRSPTQEENIR